MANKQEVYEVRLVRPEGVSVAEMKAYILDAVSAWSKGGDPASPLWNVRDNGIIVSRRASPRKD